MPFLNTNSKLSGGGKAAPLLQESDLKETLGNFLAASPKIILEI